MRSAKGVPTQLILTGNPGGAGQHWIRQRYINPAPRGMNPLVRVLPNGKQHRYVFIPSRIEDNKLLMENDPEYVNNLYLVGSEQLVKAWLEGDWNAVEGAFFDCWDSSKHVIKPFAIPAGWLRFRAGDWGSARPFSFGWYAVASDPYVAGPGIIIPRGALVRYREWYGIESDASGKHVPNKGLKLTAEAVGAGVRQRDSGELIAYGVLDPAAFSQDGGPSIAERMMRGTTGTNGSTFRRADNARVTQRGAMGGWDQLRARLVGDEDGRPMLYFFDTCVHAIRTIPALQHDQNKPEDLDSDMEDHPADEVRYACMSRPWIKPATASKAPVTPKGTVLLAGAPRPPSRTKIKV
nr:terminase [Rhizobium leucaenae]